MLGKILTGDFQNNNKVLSNIKFGKFELSNKMNNMKHVECW